MKNIVFSTTRQWNPGDEFILMGCINLLKEYMGEFNPIIYNRHPQLRRSRKRDIIKMIDNLVGKDFIEKFLDNSVKERLEMDYADLVVFAGSPEWRGRRLPKLYDSIVKYNIPTLFLGVGSGSGAVTITKNHFTDTELQVLQKAKLFTCRDCSNQDNAENILDLKVHHLPCPALFSSTKEKSINEVKKIALIYGTYEAVRDNNISRETYDYLMKIYKYILENYKDKYEIEFVAHYIDELSAFKKDFPNEELHYSYDSKDYLEIYEKYDLIIGHRVHGIGMSASIGIPGIMIAHDMRSQTVDGFAASKLFVGEPLEKFHQLFQTKINNIARENSNLYKHKQKYKEIFLQLLNESGVKELL